MSKLRILSVAENNGDSDSLTAHQKYRTRNGNWEFGITIDLNRTVVIKRKYETSTTIETLTFSNLDIDGIIEYLAEVKQLISEQEVINKLMGKNNVQA